MRKTRSYFEIFDQLKEPGCPVCSLVLKASRSYLDSLMYERVLDVPTRLELIEAFGLCNWHVWQVPQLPALCSPHSGFSILASDLLKKFGFLSRALTAGAADRRRWKLSFHSTMRKLLARAKQKPCPACRHVGLMESYYLKGVADFIRDEEFLRAYTDSQGLCLPHFFQLARSSTTHPNFAVVWDFQTRKAASLNATVEEFIRKQDHRLQHEVTPVEAAAWRAAMEFLTGKPGIFPNEMGRDS